MYARIIHKYFALIVFSQLVIWLTTGFLLGQAEHSKPLTRAISDPIVSSVSPVNILPVESVLSRLPGTLTIELISLMGNPAYKLLTQYARHTNERHYQLIDAVTGQNIQLTESDIRDLVSSQFHLTSPIKDIRLVFPPIEHLPKERQSVWHIRLSDTEKTHIYIRASTAEIAGVIDENKEWINVLMLLHFMDYERTGSFDHWWIKLLALLTVLLSITGITWLVSRIKNKQMQIGWSHSKHKLVVRDPQGHTQCVTASANDSLLDSLQRSAIAIESVCGGGGTCGQCVVLLNPSASISVAEHYRLSRERLASGYRLACQQGSELNRAVELVECSKRSTLSFELISNTFITPFIKELRFQYQGTEALDFKPGSFVQFMIKEGQSLAFPKHLPKRYQPYWPCCESKTFFHPRTVRHYSIANRNDGSGILTFNIKMQPAHSPNQKPGIGSFHLANLNVGTVVDLGAPEGGFNLPVDLSNRDIILIGGGSGIAPLKALIDELIFGRRSTAPITLFYGAKHPVELANHCWLNTVGSQYANFTYQPIVSNSSSIWCGQTGHVQKPLYTFLSAHRALDRCLFFVCGHPAMMKDVSSLLTRYSVNERAIQIDSFSPFTTT
ncbi:MAG: oxidoreductase [Alteromonadaceae bacterium]|jgi:Na(+)-translocating NADH:ubiquinone oxidoreductase F subunit|uniref:NQR complex subunit F n=1 Tax=Paraglaciecola agarilytica NO2 TaxID=1125747 RepID=A0ABQ0I188_9ALTE|nr:2Fe-2S iron-sulfur cluster-binding protein [Paraglaciecola agarilytica]MBN26993.1 oxidoreductase [Alteromonadaceae bacterium]GAC03079.1 hypothetical protein GAGA_0214 [Paraglaciecola agarilytica NO2]|tara:strand:+ start:4320 stop:6152 length:1833 start_codon:yes stop_codon:yes gene_type:complete